MSSLNTKERELLLRIRQGCNDLAVMLHAAIDMGFDISFNVNGMKGEVENFVVNRKVPVDLGKELNN
jgi:hypothetical protein